MEEEILKASLLHQCERVAPRKALIPAKKEVPTPRMGLVFSPQAASISDAVLLRIRTGTDFDAGTLLSFAKCESGISTLHSG